MPLSTEITNVPHHTYILNVCPGRGVKFWSLCMQVGYFTNYACLPIPFTFEKMYSNHYSLKSNPYFILNVNEV